MVRGAWLLAITILSNCVTEPQRLVASVQCLQRLAPILDHTLVWSFIDCEVVGIWDTCAIKPQLYWHMRIWHPLIRAPVLEFIRSRNTDHCFPALSSRRPWRITSIAMLVDKSPASLRIRHYQVAKKIIVKQKTMQSNAGAKSTIVETIFLIQSQSHWDPNHKMISGLHDV